MGREHSQSSVITVIASLTWSGACCGIYNWTLGQSMVNPADVEPWTLSQEFDWLHKETWVKHLHLSWFMSFVHRGGLHLFNRFCAHLASQSNNRRAKCSRNPRSFYNEASIGWWDHWCQMIFAAVFISLSIIWTIASLPVCGQPPRSVTNILSL